MRLRVATPTALSLALGFLVIAAGCAPSRSAASPPTQEPTAAAPQSTVAAPRYQRSGTLGTGFAAGNIARVGAALSLTGAAKFFGTAQRSGIKLAQDEINASKSLGNTRLEIVVEDDGSDRSRAAAVFQRFIENSHVLAIIGPTQSDTALAVDPIAQQAGVPVLAISNTANGVTRIGNFIFRNCLSEGQVTPQIVKAVRTRFDVHNVALLYTDSDAGRAGSNGFKKALHHAGIRIVSEQVFARDQTDFSPQLEEIAASRPDALFITAPGSLAAQLLIQVRQHGMANLPVIGSTMFNSDSVVRNAGDAAEGLIVGSSWTAANPSLRNQQFIQSYHARYGIDPDSVAAQAYSGVYILASALQDSGTVTDPRAVRDALERVKNLETPLGPFSFNDAHDAGYNATVQIVRKGRFQPF